MTAIFIVFFYVAVVPFDRTHLRIAASYLAIWAAVCWSGGILPATRRVSICRRRGT